MAASIWKVADYRKWFVGDTFLQASRVINGFAFPILVILSTGSTQVAGTIQAMIGILSALILIPSGMLADSINRRTGVLVFGSIYTALMIAFSIVLSTSGADTITLMLFAVFFVLLSAPLGYCIDAMLKSILAPAQFPIASAAEEARSSALGIALPPVAGFLISLRQWIPFVFTALGTFAAVIGVWLIKDREGFTPRDHEGQRRKPFSGWREGFGVIWRTPALTRMISASLLANLAFSGINATLIYAWTAEGRSPVQLGFLATALSIGSLLGALVAPKIIDGRPGGIILIISMGTATLFTALLAPLYTSPLIFLAMAITAFSMPSYNAVISGYQVAKVPNELQARAGASAELLAVGAAPLGPLIAGFGLAAVAPQALLAFFAAFCVLATLSIATSAKVRSVAAPNTWGD